MKRKSIITIIFIISFLFVYASSVYPTSAIIKTQIDYTRLLYELRRVQVMIDNFAKNEQKDKFNDITNEFQNAAIDYYGHNFAYYDKTQKKYNVKFYIVKSKLCSLLEDMTKIYLERTNELLASTSKDAFTILIKFTKGGYAKYFTKPVDPVSLIEHQKLYKSDEYHFYHDKETIERYLRKGHKAFQDAKKIYADYDVNLIKSKKEKNYNDLNYLIDNYKNIIDFCRQAKQYGIEIYRIIKVNNINNIQQKYEKYNISLSNPEPVFDVRIPDNYKVDANDNIGLVHSIEIKKIPPDFPKSSDLDKK